MKYNLFDVLNGDSINMLGVQFRGDVAKLKDSITISDSDNNKFKIYDLTFRSAKTGEFLCEFSMTSSELKAVPIDPSGAFKINGRELCFVNIA